MEAKRNGFAEGIGLTTDGMVGDLRLRLQERQVQKARETMDIYAPLAGRMGMQWMREELEDLSFRVLNPEARNSIIRRFITLQREAGDVIEIKSGDDVVTADLDRVNAEIESDLGLAWPPGVYSLSHVAVNFPPDDPIKNSPGGISIIVSFSPPGSSKSRSTGRSR